MADCHESPSVTVTTDAISTDIVDTIYDVTLTNRTSDLPKSKRKRTTGFTTTKKGSRKLSKTVTPPPSPTPPPSQIPPESPTHTPPQQTVNDICKLIAAEIAISLFNTQAERVAISYYYHIAMSAPPISEWSGWDGTISTIRRVFKFDLNKRFLIQKVLEDSIKCKEDGKQYDGTPYFERKNGPTLIIDPGSMEENIVANWMESDLGFRRTTDMVNQYRRDMGKIELGRNAIMNAFFRMTPLVTKIEKIPQGNKNHVAWALARKNQTKQMMIMCGIFTITLLTLEYPLGIPEYFDPAKLPELECEQIIWFDEVHMEQHGGPLSSTGYQIRFPRNVLSGKLDARGGKYAKKKTVPLTNTLDRLDSV